MRKLMYAKQREAINRLFIENNAVLLIQRYYARFLIIRDYVIL